MPARKIAVAIAIGALMTSAATTQMAPTTRRSINQIKKVVVTSRDGTRIQLGSRIEQGKPTLIAFWASWCPPCMAEGPHLASLRTALGRSYNFLYIDRRDGDPDPLQDPMAIAQFLQRTDMIDADYVTADVAAYRRIVGADMKTIPEGIVGIPRVYLFDRHGREVYTTMGFSDLKSLELEQQLKRVIADR